MKKILAVLLTLTMTLSLFACGNTEEEPQKEKETVTYGVTENITCLNPFFYETKKEEEIVSLFTTYLLLRDKDGNVVAESIPKTKGEGLEESSAEKSGEDVDESSSSESEKESAKESGSETGSKKKAIQKGTTVAESTKETTKATTAESTKETTKATTAESTKETAKATTAADSTKESAKESGSKETEKESHTESASVTEPSESMPKVPEYEGICDVTEKKTKEENEYRYQFELRKDLKFSDGEAVTIDDVIFSLYVLMDPLYDGKSIVRTLPLKGADDYRAGVTTLSDALVKAGRENETYTYWTQETQEKFWADLDAAGESFVQEIVNYVFDNYGTDEYIQAYFNPHYTRQNLEEHLNLKVAYAMCMWGFGDFNDSGKFEAQNQKVYDFSVDDLTTKDFWECMYASYNGDIKKISDVENAGKDLFSFMTDERVYSKKIYNGNSAEYITGIERLSDFEMALTFTKNPEDILKNVRIPVAPLHGYGNAEEYDYNHQKFGFTKGNLDGIREKAPLGMGMYEVVENQNGTVRLKFNENYYGSFSGEPKDITIIKTAQKGILSSMQEKNQDVVVTPLTEELEKEFRDKGDEKLTLMKDELPGYGFIGMSPRNMRVGDENISGKSNALRKGFMALFYAFREEAVKNYFGNSASLLDTQIEGIVNPYGVGVDEKPLYTSEMTDEERTKAARKAAVALFREAGFTYDEKEEKFTDMTKTYTVLVPGDQEKNHPLYEVMEKAADVLQGMGITLQIDDVEETAYRGRIAAEDYMIYVGFYDTASNQSDLLMAYSSAYSITSVSDTFDALLLQGRYEASQKERDNISAQVYSMLFDYGLELPAYKRSDAIITSLPADKFSKIDPALTENWCDEGTTRLIRTK